MNKIILTIKDIDELLKWRDNHKELVRLVPEPLGKLEIEIPETKWKIKCFREGGIIKFQLNNEGVALGHCDFQVLKTGMRLIKNTTKIEAKDLQSVLTVYCSLMALMTFGNDSDEYEVKQKDDKPQEDNLGKSKKKTRSKNSKSLSYTYILQRRNTGHRQNIHSTYRKPTMPFSVRGHYRHYKSGKTIWIAEYKKGNGISKDKVYKLGNISEQ